MNVGLLVLAAIVGYFIGSFSFARLMVKIFAPQVDIEKVLIIPSSSPDKPSKMLYISPSTVSSVVGTKAGIAAGLLDMFKGMLVVLIFKILFPGQYYFLMASVMVIIGHIWPIYYHFHGGGGLTTLYGSLLVVDPLCVPVVAILGLLFGFLILRDDVAAYSSGVLFTIPWFWFRTNDWVFLVYAVALNAILLTTLYPVIMMQWNAHKAGQHNLVTSMEYIPMGRGMLKIGRKLGFVK